jgi:hypothetical protein
MPFNTLMLNCLIHKTSFGESGCKVSIRKESNESILFFNIDEKSNPESTFRKALNIRGKMCDLAVYYSNDNQKILCFVELKGCHIEDAVEQVENTYLHFKKLLKRRVPKIYKQIGYKAFVVTHGASPKNVKKIKRKFINIFGKENADISRNRNFGKFLRK